ncbi:MAG: hypothetical protein K0U21_00295 [Proteobacteria bacterium]|nr:hypothetical protein [Pseudomonadota bacterium]
MIDQCPIPNTAKKKLKAFMDNFDAEIPIGYCLKEVGSGFSRLRFICLQSGEIVGFVLYSLTFFDASGDEDPPEPTLKPLKHSGNAVCVDLCYLFVNPVWQKQGLMSNELGALAGDIIESMLGHDIESITCTADFVSEQGETMFNYFVGCLQSEVDVFGLNISIDTDAGF